MWDKNKRMYNIQPPFKWIMFFPGSLSKYLHLLKSIDCRRCPAMFFRSDFCNFLSLIVYSVILLPMILLRFGITLSSCNYKLRVTAVDLAWNCTSHLWNKTCYPSNYYLKCTSVEKYFLQHIFIFSKK